MNASDDTEATRREMIATGQPARDLAQASHSLTTDELRRDYIVYGFAAPFVIVTRKSDGKKGTFEFTHHPRRYFNFVEDK